MNKEDEISNLLEKINENDDISESEEDESQDEMYIDCSYHIDPIIMNNYKNMFIQRVNDYMELHLDDTMDEILTFNKAKNILIQEEDGTYYGNKLTKDATWIFRGIDL